MIQPPAMTPGEIAAHPDPAPPVRVSCYLHQCTLFVGDELPEGGTEAVALAAGCPAWERPSEDLERFADCPVPAEIAVHPPTVTVPPESAVLPQPLSGS